MTELDILIHAKDYIDKLAQGIDPISGQEVPEDSVINQARLVRCFFYVSGVLERVIDNGGRIERAAGVKGPFQLTDEMRSRIVYSADPINISKFVHQLNELRDGDLTKKLSATTITGWLLEKGFLQIQPDDRGRKCKLPTEAGQSLGLSQETRYGEYGSYLIVLYNEDAQRFIIDHMEDILHPVEPEAE